MGIFILKMRLNCHKSGSRFKVVRMVPVVRRAVTCCLKNAEIKKIVKLQLNKQIFGLTPSQVVRRRAFAASWLCSLISGCQLSSKTQTYKTKRLLQSRAPVSKNMFQFRIFCSHSIDIHELPLQAPKHIYQTQVRSLSSLLSIN